LGANQRGRMIEATMRQQMINDGKGTTLYGFSDGSMPWDRNYGGYSWILVLRSPQHPMGKVVMGGGGAEAEAAASCQWQCPMYCWTLLRDWKSWG
jgi:hypothetical protein